MITLLSWASLLHVPSALLALQGVDASGKMVHAALQKHGVSDAWVVVSPEFATAENHVFAVEGKLGKASTIMDTASTSLINVQRMRKHFSPSLRTAGVCVAEIGSVPCSAVDKLLQDAKAKKRLTLLAVDVLPTIVIGDSRLGTLEELQSCITNADVLMQPRDVAEQLLYMTADETMAYEDMLSLPTTELASLLRSSTGADLVAIVDGDMATKGCVLATLGASVHIPPVGACAAAARDPAANSASEVDSVSLQPEDRGPIVPLVHDVGVTHAFYGGLLSALYHAGGIPTETAAITQTGYVANATASACLRNLFALPDVENPDVLFELNNDPTICAILDAVREEKEEVQSAEDGSGLDSTVARMIGARDMSAYRASYEKDAEQAGRLKDLSGAHGRSGDATRADTIVNELFACEAMGGTVLVTAEQEEAGVARRLALSLVACGFRAQFVTASDAAAWPHGWAYSVRSTDTIICISHAGHAGNGSVVEAIGAVRSVQQTANERPESIAPPAGRAEDVYTDELAGTSASAEDAELVSAQEDDALAALEVEHSGLQGLLRTPRCLTVVSIVGGMDNAGTDRNSALQSLSDHVLSYANDADSDSGTGTIASTFTNNDSLQQRPEGATAMRQQMDHVGAMGSCAIAQQMVVNALVAELVDRLKNIIDAEHDL